MIQRVQTIFLMLIALCMGLMLAYYIWGELIPDQNRVISFSAFKMEVIDTQGTLQNVSDDVVVDSQNTWYIGALAILSVITAMFSIFMFKNRLTQMKLGALNSLFMVATLAISYLHINRFEKIFPETVGQTQLGFFLPVAAMLLNMIANRFIRKDEKLVKSVDRIR